jgi:hypothetical protein
MADAASAALPFAIPRTRSWVTSRVVVIALFGAALAAGMYWVLRAGGRWAEGDSARMATSIRNVAQTGQLAPHLSGVYPNGYAYQAVSTAIMAFTGVDVVVLQQIVYPLFSAALILPAWALYREVGGTRVAVIATSLLLLVPEFEFTVLRGSHERLDRTFTLILLWLVARGFRRRSGFRILVAHVALVALMAFGLVATNVLFGISLAAALGIGAAFSWVLSRRLPSAARSMRLFAQEVWQYLAWIAALIGVLVVIFVTFVYPPAGHALQAISVVPSQVVKLLLGSEPPSNPYRTVTSSWVNSGVYLFLSVGNIVILVGSALAWAWFGRRWLRGQSTPSFALWTMWLLFAALAIQGILAVLADMTGVLGGNLEYRLFVSFTVVAAPILAAAVARWQLGPFAASGLAVCVFLVAIASLLKATNEPALSNQWTFYTADELRALEWADGHQRSTETWVGQDERLAAAHMLAVGLPQNANSWVFKDVEPSARSFVISDIVVLQSLRVQRPIPPVGDEQRVYDNGTVQVYRKRALAAFEP